MKRLFLVLTIVLLMLIGIVGFIPSAQLSADDPITYNTPKPTTTPEVTPIPTFVPIPTSKGSFCMNFGHNAYSYDQGLMNEDLDRLIASKIRCIKIAAIGWNNHQSHTLALLAKSKGFRVTIGGDWPVLASNQLSEYRDQVIEEAKWAQINKIDQLSIGNEQEYNLGDITQPQWANFLRSLATDVKQVYSGVVSYDTSGDYVKFWATQNLGNIDMLGLNLYCGYLCNVNYLLISIRAHGIKHIYIAETNADMGLARYANDSTHADQVSGDFLKLLSFGVPVYYFTYESCDEVNGVSNHWGLYQCNTLTQPLTAQALGVK